MKLYFRDILNYFTKGDDRTLKVKKNIFLMLLYKGGSILISFLLVPLTINYVDSECYGIWLTLSSMIAWMSFFDIGLNNGLKNKLAEALAKNDFTLGQKYVSTTYAILALIFIPLMILLLCGTPFIHWSSLLNLPVKYEYSLFIASVILIVYFCLNFILSTINVVMMANQQPADASLRTLLQQAISLLIIYVLTLTTQGNLINLCLALCASPLIIALAFNFSLFKGRYAKVAPRLSMVDFAVVPSLMKLGIQFFIIQIASIIQWQMANLLIMRYLGANSVTEYNIVYKYFSVLAMLWGILNAPIWSAVTDALTKKDYDWIRRMVRKFIKYFIVFSFGGVLMLIISPWVYDIWIGNKVSIAFTLSAAVLLYNIFIMFGGIFIAVVNGSGKLKIQMYACLISPFVYLFTFYVCSSIMHLGIYSVIIAAIVANFNGLILAPMQCHKLLRK